MTATRELRHALRAMRAARGLVGKSRQRLPLGAEDTLRRQIQLDLLRLEEDVRAALRRAREAAVAAEVRP